MVFASYGSFGYNVFALGHLLSVIVAFSPAMVWPVANRMRRTAGTTANAVKQAATGNLDGLMSPAVHGGALVASGLFGILLVVTESTLFGFDQMWISIAFLLWFIMLGVVFALLVPAQRALEAGEADADRRISMAYGAMHLLLLLQIIDMVWKPGL